MKFGKRFFAAAILAAMVFGGGQLMADESDWWIMKPIEKLGRGIANVAFGALEVPMKMWDVNEDAGGIAGLTYGPLRGVCFCIAREVVGVVDIITFPFPLPGCPDDPNGFGAGYGPIMRPAWVVDVEHDWNNFVYDRGSIVDETF